MIGMGDRGQGVKNLQRRLKAVGCDPDDIDGFFGNRTLVAVKAFQERYESLESTGVLDPS